MHRSIVAIFSAAAMFMTAAPADSQSDPAPAAAISPAAAMPMGANGDMADDNRYGGTAYGGTPDLAATSALVQAGGGGSHFSIAKALDAMVGPDLTKAEVQKLTAQYGEAAVTSWSQLFTFAIADALKVATAAGVALPPPAPGGKALAARLVEDGVTQQTFWTGRLLDKLVTHQIHDSVMDDINAKYGKDVDVNYHKITNQAMYDLARALGNNQVELAYFH